MREIKRKAAEQEQCNHRARLIYQEEKAWITAYLEEQISAQIVAAARAYRVQSGDISTETSGKGRFYEARVPGVHAVLPEQVVKVGTCMMSQSGTGSRHFCGVRVPEERLLRKLAQELSERIKEKLASVSVFSSERFLYVWADLEMIERGAL